MSKANYDEPGGASIIPSARPSIHSNHICPFANTISTNMVSYGLHKNRDSDDSADEQGVDVVDNILSKPAHQIGSLSQQRNIKRNSLTSENRLHNQPIYTEDNDTNILSKSVPAALPSYSRYRDSQNSQDENTSPNRSQQFNTSNLSYHSSNSPGSDRTQYRSTTRSNYVPQQILETSHMYIQKERSSLNSTSIITILSVVAILVSIFLSTQSFNVSNVSNESTYDEFKFYTELGGLGEKYNVDEDSILQVQTGIATIAEKQDTGSFIFVYNSDVDNFNQGEFNKFMHDVSFTASKYLRNDSTPLHYTTVEGTKLDMKEHCELITRYRLDLERTGLMLVRHVEDVPSELAMAFHYYCDEYNPLVKKSAIFFTFNLAKCPQGPVQKSNHALIENCLKSKWSGVSTDSIGPLLTRVISVVIDVTAAF